MQVAQQQVNKSLPMVQNVSCVLPQTEEKGGLFIGNYFGATNIDILKERGIRAVLTTSIETPISYQPEHIPFHMKIEAHDRNNFSILEHFEKCLKFIEQSRKHTNILVHCYAGVSRSSSIVLAYLMKYQGWTFDTSLNFLKHKRSVVNPNEGFKMQLREYEKNLAMTQPALSVSQGSSSKSIKESQQRAEPLMIPSPTLMKRSFVGLVHKHQPPQPIVTEVSSPKFQQSLKMLPQQNQALSRVIPPPDYQAFSRVSLDLTQSQKSKSISKRQKQPTSLSFKYLPEMKGRISIPATTKSIQSQSSNMSKKQQVIRGNNVKQLQPTAPLTFSRNIQAPQSSKRKINI